MKSFLKQYRKHLDIHIQDDSTFIKDNQRFRAGLDSLAKNNKRRNILKDRLSRILVLFKIIIRKA